MNINQPDAVLQDGDKVWVDRLVLVGFTGYNEIKYGFVLEDLYADEFAYKPTWGCDLFFRDPAFEEHDVRRYLWLEESRKSCAQFSTPEEAVKYAEGTLSGMMRQLEESGYLDLEGIGRHKLTIFKVKPALVE